MVGLIMIETDGLMDRFSANSGLRPISLPSTYDWITTCSVPLDLASHERDGKD